MEKLAKHDNKDIKDRVLISRNFSTQHHSTKKQEILQFEHYRVQEEEKKKLFQSSKSAQT